MKTPADFTRASALDDADRVAGGLEAGEQVAPSLLNLAKHRDGRGIGDVCGRQALDLKDSEVDGFYLADDNFDLRVNHDKGALWHGSQSSRIEPSVMDVSPQTGRQALSAFVRLYEAGLSMKQVAAQIGVSVGAVHRRLALSGIQRRKPRPKLSLSPVQSKDVRHLYVEGKTLAEIGQTFGASRSQIRSHLIRIGQPLRRKRERLLAGEQPLQVGFRRCSDCRTVDDLAAFSKKSSRCRPCEAAHGRSTNLKLSYGISENDYEKMLAAQGGVCRACKNPESMKRRGSQSRLSVDHCHRTGRVRGLLCSGCNTAIGLLKDDPARAEAIARYLRQGEDVRHGLRCA